jgi:hypothetical protein
VKTLRDTVVGTLALSGIVFVMAAAIWLGYGRLYARGDHNTRPNDTAAGWITAEDASNKVIDASNGELNWCAGIGDARGATYRNFLCRHESAGGELSTPTTVSRSWYAATNDSLQPGNVDPLTGVAN